MKMGMLVLYIGLFVLSSFAHAEEFLPSTNYLILVNGMKVPDTEMANKKVVQITYVQLRDYRVTDAVRATALYQNLHKQIADQKLTALPFAVEFSTDANRSLTSATLITTTARFPIAATGNPPPPSLPPQNNATHRVVLVVNRAPDATDQTPNGEVISMPFNLFQEVKVANTDRQNLIEKIRTEVTRLGLQSTPFAVTWSEDAQHKIVGDAVLKAGNTEYKIALTATPMPTPTVPGPLTLEGIEAAIDAKTDPTTIFSRLLTWSLTAPDTVMACQQQGENFSFSDNRVGRVFQLAGLITHADLRKAALVQALPITAKEAGLEARLNAVRRRSTAGCLQPIYAQLWNTLVEQRRSTLLEDFISVLHILDQHRKEMRYAENTQTLEAPGELLGTLLLFIDMAFDTFEPRELAALPREFREWATRDTNDSDPKSRVEPVDVMALHLSQSKLGTEATHTELGVSGMNGVAKNAVQHLLAPEIYPVEVVASHSSAVYTQAHGSAFFVYCPGGQLSAASDASAPINSLHLAPFATLTQSYLQAIQSRGVPFQFDCGSVRVTTSLAETPRIEVTDPLSANPNFRFGDDRKIKAVATFPLVNTVSETFINAMKAGTALKGFKEINMVETADLRQDFLTEMQDADIYFPTAHYADISSFEVGWPGGRTLRLEQATDKGTVELVVFLPPAKPTTGKVTLTDADIVKLFKQRRRQPVRRRLTLVNIACGSAKYIPGWSRAYQLSLENENLLPQDLQAEVPILIGSTKSFNSSTIDNLLAYAEYPLCTMKVASQEGTLQDLLTALNKDFAPASNLNKGEKFAVGDNKKGTHLQVATSDGKRKIF